MTGCVYRKKKCTHAFRRMYLDGRDVDKVIAQTNAYLDARYGFWLFWRAQLLIAGGPVPGPVPFGFLAYWLLIADRVWLIFRGRLFLAQGWREVNSWLNEKSERA